MAETFSCIEYWSIERGNPHDVDARYELKLFQMNKPTKWLPWHKLHVTLIKVKEGIRQNRRSNVVASDQLILINVNCLKQLHRSSELNHVLIKEICLSRWFLFAPEYGEPPLSVRRYLKWPMSSTSIEWNNYDGVLATFCWERLTPVIHVENTEHYWRLDTILPRWQFHRLIEQDYQPDRTSCTEMVSRLYSISSTLSISIPLEQQVRSTEFLPYN